MVTLQLIDIVKFFCSPFPFRMSLIISVCLRFQTAFAPFIIHFTSPRFEFIYLIQLYIDNDKRIALCFRPSSAKAPLYIFSGSTLSSKLFKNFEQTKVPVTFLGNRYFRLNTVFQLTYNIRRLDRPLFTNKMSYIQRNKLFRHPLQKKIFRKNYTTILMPNSSLNPSIGVSAHLRERPNYSLIPEEREIPCKRNFCAKRYKMKTGIIDITAAAILLACCAS